VGGKEGNVGVAEEGELVELVEDESGIRVGREVD